jgi:hypothetical protein
MRFDPARVTAAVLVCTTGCVFTYDGERRVTHRPAPSEARVRANLPGRGSLQPDGTVQFALDLDKLCQRDRMTTEEIGIDKRKRFSPFGFGFMAVSAASLTLGIYAFTKIEGSGSGNGLEGTDALLLVGGVFGSLFGAGGVILPISLRYADPVTFPRSKGYEKVETREIHEGIDVGRCPAGAPAVGDLVFTTPWGTTTKGNLRGDGLATFSVDWSANRAAEIPREQLASGWSIASPSTNAVATMRLSREDTDQVVKLIAKARERVVVGATDAHLAVTVATGVKGLEIGGTGQLVIDVTNDGGSTATNVTAKTRSSLPALHGLTASFGIVQPGASARRTLDVKLPLDITDDSAKVIVVVADGAGKSTEVTQNLPLALAVCPGGKLTRERYNEKRAKMKRALTAKEMSQEDFDKFDTDMLRCLE